MRDELMASMKNAMKSGDRLRVDTLRMAQAALKNKDIEARGSGKTVSGDDELAVLQKLVKSRQEAAELYEKGGRKDLAEKERAEVVIISEFLPKPMAEDDVKAAIADAVSATGAKGPADMGKVIGALRAKYAGRIDFGKASPLVKSALAAK